MSKREREREREKEREGERERERERERAQQKVFSYRQPLPFIKLILTYNKLLNLLSGLGII